MADNAKGNSPKRILIVDNAHSMQRLVSRILEGAGFVTDVASDPGKPHVEIPAVQVFINHSHDNLCNSPMHFVT